MSPRLPGRLLAAQSDGCLIELIGAGHERAFEVLVQRYRRPLLAYCLRMGLSETLAEDVLQHALLRAWIALGQGTEVREPRPWLYRIVHNTAVNALRGAREDQRPLIAAMALGTPVASEHDPECRLAVRQTLSDVAALPQMQRDAILLSAIDGRSHEEVASALGITDGAVRGLLYRARVALRGAAAALTPGPLIGWAAGAASRMAPSAARLAEIAGPGSDTGGMVMKGVAVAATAALAAGAVLVPLHARGAHSHARRPAAAALAGATAAAATPGADSVRPQHAVGSPPSGAAGSRGATSGPRGGSRVSVGGRSTPRSRRVSTPLQQRVGQSHAQPIVSSGPTQGSLGRSTATGAGAGAGESSGAASAGSATGPAPAAGQPPPAGGPEPSGGGASGGEGDGGAEREAEVARERAEHEAEVARETREHEEEATREQHEREEEAARERREREAEAGSERAGS